MITQKDVEYIANLARIDLTDAEKSMFETELSGILSFVEKLNELNLDEVDSMSPSNNPMLLENIMRTDEQEDAYMEKKSALLVEAAAETKDNYVRVKSVFE